ncbi:MAG TPA: plastocyanin/azurin family copper-binding protein [Vicinamibacterales bacterium]
MQLIRAALVLVACSALLPLPAYAQAAKPAAQKPAAQKPAAGDKTAARTVEIVGTDNMKYSVTTIKAKPGEMLRIRLTSKGTMPKVAMAHNFVLLKPGTDPGKFANAAALHRATNFIPPNMKDQVIASTGLAGNGETVEVTFKVPAKGKYTFICTFPGHFAAGMTGTLVVG